MGETEHKMQIMSRPVYAIESHAITDGGDTGKTEVETPQTYTGKIGEVYPEQVMKTSEYYKQGRDRALREVLELIKAEKVFMGDIGWQCDADSLKTKVGEMIEGSK